MRDWYGFGAGRADGNRDDRALLGGKGANLAEMSRLGLPVPPGYTLPTTLCADNAHALTQATLTAIDEGLLHIETVLQGSNSHGPKLGNPKNPLLVSVRSGAAVSMPGMMDTVLNIGLNRDGVEGLAELSGDRRFALDSYRRLIQMFGDVVMGVERAALDAPLRAVKQERGIEHDSELDADALAEVVERVEQVYEQHAREPFPQQSVEQLRRAVRAVFASWDTDRAQAYRRMRRIDKSIGTAANVQAMVFGNFGPTSGTGVLFTRNPSTGERRTYGEWLPNAQGEDVVAGIRTPGALAEIDVDAERPGPGSLETAMPETFGELMGIVDRLERHYRDVQDVEFTIQEGRLFVLQTRNAKRTAAAAVKIAVDLVEEALINRDEAVMRLDPEAVDTLLHPQVDPDASVQPIAKGLPASPGAAAGRVVFDSESAAREKELGKRVVLVREETSPEDIVGMDAAAGILTQTGGMTSHAAVVARGMGRPCVTGCDALRMGTDGASATFSMGGKSVTVSEGDFITIDGSNGQVYLGEVPTVEADLGGEIARLLSWADRRRRLDVRTNADTPKDVARAVELGAGGIGLCRTEHMFFGDDRIIAVREMILAANGEERAAALAKLEPFQRQDFEGIFRALGGRPATIRLLDPPLHEFLPKEDEEVGALAASLGMPKATVWEKVRGLAEQNPMLGHRGCRLGITFPEIYEMQVRAIFEAALKVVQEGIHVVPEIMVPLVMHPT
ncbi:MAG: pyruvate, phosphate dikinase, partial [Myxococcota bacterium]